VRGREGERERKKERQKERVRERSVTLKLMSNIIYIIFNLFVL